jgi:hypothetical protein
LKTVHLEMAEANAMVAAIHRHHKPVRGYRFAIWAEHAGRLVGAAIVGRPVARQTDQRNTVEVTRLVTDGTPTACSFLYGAAARAARELGYHRIQTFILESEPGTSLIAAGWMFDGMTSGGRWTYGQRTNRRDDQPTCPKKRFVKELRRLNHHGSAAAQRTTASRRTERASSPEALCAAVVHIFASPAVPSRRLVAPQGVA